MNKIHKTIYFFIIASISSSYAQTIVSQPENAYELLTIKNTIDNSFSIYNNYSVQLLSTSDKDKAKSEYDKFKNKHPLVENTIIRNRNSYTIFAGNYKNKIEAYNLSKILKKEYPNNFMVHLGISKKTNE